MAELDLIPAAYRQRIEQQQWLRTMAVVLLSMVLVGAALRGGLAYATHQVRAQVEEMRMRETFGTQQREQLDRLDAALDTVRKEWRLLRGLRAGTNAEQLFLVVDRALPAEEVWFTRWEFRRAGVLVSEAPGAVETGYFIVLPANQRGANSQAWQVRTHMTVTGQARDHAALARFARELFAQPEVADVRLQRTTLRRLTAADVVEFELAVVLDRTLADDA